MIENLQYLLALYIVYIILVYIIRCLQIQDKQSLLVNCIFNHLLNNAFKSYAFCFQMCLPTMIIATLTLIW